jgi:predicted kinase
MFAVVITGPPGSGKTSVLTALHDLLAEHGIRHAVIEVEALAQAHPHLSDEQSFGHVAALREMYANAGYELIICGATVTSDAYMSALLAALAPTGHLVVRLDATSMTLRQRIVEREPPEWSGLPGLLSAADRIAATSRLLEQVDLTYSTEDASARTIAGEIRDASPALRAR